MEVIAEEDTVLLYYSSGAVGLREVAGEVHPITREGFITSKGLSPVRERCEPLRGLGDEYSDILVPALPAYDLVPCPPSPHPMEELSSLPGSLGVPLMKGTPEEGGEVVVVVQGYHSGVRSALVKEKGDGRWYRLKGCGNGVQGMVVEKVESTPTYPHHYRNLRGCCFPHTAYRELHMTTIVHHLLVPEGAITANTPLGWYHYHDTPLSLLQPTCAIFATVGDRRLADHLLAGLDQLLPLLLASHDDGHHFKDSLMGRFTLNRRDGDKVIPTPSVVICEMYDHLVDIRDLPLPLTTTSPLPPHFTPLWTSCVGHLQSQGSSNLVAWLYYRLGYEAGRVLKRMHGGGVSWGTYHDRLGTHCNAHANNFVVVDPVASSSSSSSSSGFLLAPLDFDMAFRKEDFLPDYHQGSTGAAMSFDEMLYMEVQCCVVSLAGDDSISTGVSGASSSSINSSSSSSSSSGALRWAMRDTLVKGFFEGFSKDKGQGLPLPPLVQHDAFLDIIRLALMLTSHRIV